MADIWASAGDVLPPEHPTIGITNRAGGFPRSWSLPGGPTPPRQLWNWFWRVVSTFGAEVATAGGALPWDARQVYASLPALVSHGGRHWAANEQTGPGTLLGAVEPTAQQSTWVPVLLAGQVGFENLAGVLGLEQGGTGASTAAGARAALGAAAATHTHGSQDVGRRRIRNVSGAVTVATADDRVVFAFNTAGSNGVANLPDLTSAHDGWSAIFTKRGAANTVTLRPNGADRIEGQTSYAFDGASETVEVVWDGATWDVIRHSFENPLPVAHGGTGAGTKAGARSALGLLSAALRDVGDVDGRVPLVGTGNKLSRDVIPDGTASARGGLELWQSSDGVTDSVRALTAAGAVAIGDDRYATALVFTDVASFTSWAYRVLGDSEGSQHLVLGFFQARAAGRHTLGRTARIVMTKNTDVPIGFGRNIGLSDVDIMIESTRDFRGNAVNMFSYNRSTDGYRLLGTSPDITLSSITYFRLSIILRQMVD